MTNPRKCTLLRLQALLAQEVKEEGPYIAKSMPKTVKEIQQK